MSELFLKTKMALTEFTPHAGQVPKKSPVT